MTSVNREKILLSWKQCYKKGIEKDIDEINKRANEAELTQRRKRNKELIEIFNDNVENLLEKYTVRNTVFLLTDKDMVLISKREKIKKDCPIKISEGDHFDEETCGTNAISLASELRDKVLLKGDDHYCYLFQELGCIAAPIIVNQKIIAFLDLSVLNREIREKDKMLFDLLYQAINLEISKLAIEVEEAILNKKEKRILKLSAKGYSIKEIAKKMILSSSTIKYYRTNICKKLEAENITHAVAKVLKNSI